MKTRNLLTIPMTRPLHTQPIILRATVLAFVLFSEVNCAKTWTCDEARGDFCVRGLLVQGLPPQQQRPDIRARLEHEIDVAVAYWGGTVQDLQGLRIVYRRDSGSNAVPGHEGQFPCDSDGGWCWGHNDRIDGTITLELFYIECPETSVLIHEIGHTMIDDPRHMDDRFQSLPAIAHEVIDQSIPSCSGLADQIAAGVNVPLPWSVAKGVH